MTSEPTEALALYRRYRPDTFAQVVGQEHVTQPLQRALANNRVNHAYLFSGPRGCGKTTSARILARALNCENGPAAEPCGHCRSCLDLATGGPGSIDVIEIDAASHGGVDDARDLRERAFFAPVQSRYKVYIIDEAHMVTTQGFNALLKLVEEPPPHVKFIFATTEPDKVIGTIRSRTHHYPFRLVPPKVLTHYLAEICEQEGITVEPGVLPLVVRAGGGSVRDSLSVLDQLLGGASDRGVTYDHATGLLGYTPDKLLDEMVGAFATGEGSGVFSVIDKVIEAGQDPRRFAEDLLGHLRDLVIVGAVPDALSTGLVDVSPEQAATYVTQAKAMGLGELTRAADVIAEGLTQMRGTTAPRLHLELMCARVLLPGADVAERGINARLDRIERRLNLGGLDTGGPVAPVTEVAGPPAASAPAPAPAAPASAPSPSVGQRPRPRHREPEPAAAATPATPAAPATPAPASTGRPVRPERPARPDRPVSVPRESAVTSVPAPAADAAGVHGLTTQDAQARWSDLLEEVGRRRHFTKVVLEGNAAVVSLVGGVLTVALNSPGARTTFERPREREVFTEAVTQVFGTALRVETIIDPDAGRQARGGRSSGRPERPEGRQRPAPVPAPSAAPAPATAPVPASADPQRPRGTRRGRPSAGPTSAPPPTEPPDDPWDEPPPEDDLYASQFAAPAAVERPSAPVEPTPTAPPPAKDEPAQRPSRYSQVAAVPPPPKELTPEEEAAAYTDEDVTVGEGYESAADLLTNVLGAELLLEEQQDSGLAG
ncbi:DNA polymerase III subunit gamma and tau [Raineyella fluvialis]|uniref:DNA polymerase III subunit gamma and tau n=1 Tax=Raineyella fluvialis TaxID=2662261 RepID=UPI001E5E0D92|nr:DNA polymerase III subunit gamma and tau [Raineyella fluvialis]